MNWLKLLQRNCEPLVSWLWLPPDVMPYKWGKLMDNLGNAIGAISNARGGDIEVIARAARKELRDLLAQAGIRWVSAEEVARELPQITMPLRGRLDSEAQSSTWQSLARRTRTIETEFLNGEVVRLAKKLGRQAPINEKLLNISLEMSANRDLPGKYTPLQLRQLLGIN
jgi:2-dehydropantoate 2-reductase